MIPKQLIDSLQNVTGFNEAEFIETHLQPKEITSIRINTQKISTLDIEELSNNYNLNISHKVPWCKEGFYLKSRPKFTFDPLLHAGAYYVQEASSMFLSLILEQLFQKEEEKIILDLCASPGGKSTLLTNYFTQGLIVSNEVIKQRATVLVENITKWGAANCIVTNNDPKDFNALTNYFDLVVVDAPCSGSGLFRKDVTAIDEWSLQNVNLCSQRQQRILADIIPSIKEDGYLIYSTCSYSKQENEDILDWLTNEFDCVSVAIQLHTDLGVVETTSDINKAFGYRFYPNKIEGEGFFIAVLKFSNQLNKKVSKLNKLIPITLNESNIVREHMLNFENYQFFKHNSNIICFSSMFYHELQTIASYLYIKKAGIEVGIIKGNTLIPAHDLAVSILCLQNFKKISLPLEVILQYLSKKVVIIDTDIRGWALINYKSINIGWIKVLDNRVNNYYPTNWRIMASIN